MFNYFYTCLYKIFGVVLFGDENALVNMMETKKSRGRPTSFKRDELIEKAMKLFWLKGFKSLSFNEIAQEVGLTRASLYNAFSTKENLLKECLAYYYQHLSPDGLLVDIDAQQSIGEVLHVVLDKAAELYTSASQRAGCFAVNSLNELMAGSDDLSVEMTQMYEARRHALENVLQMAVLRGELPSEFDAITNASVFLAYMGGLSIYSKSGAPLHTLKSMNRAFLSQVGFDLVAEQQS